MVAFAGIVRFDGAPLAGDAENRIAQAISRLRPGRTQARRGPGALFAYRADSAADGHAEQPIAGERGTLFAALARLDNRAELGAALHMPPAELARTSDARLLKRVVERWGEEGVARCLGAFAFARWDVESRSLMLGRDCTGINHALFFYRGRDFMVFATTFAALLTLPFVPREIDEIALANFMAANFREARRSIYRGIERVASRTLAIFDSAGARHRHYWSPAIGAVPPFRREEDYIERARELFDQAVATATAGTRHIAIATSGGLDSSAVAATAARLGRAERITCYTLVPPVGAVSDSRPSRYQDETGKVRALGRMYPMLDMRFLAPEAPHPFEQDDTRYFAMSGYPSNVPGNLGWFSYLHDAVAAAGHQVLLTGYFGNFGLTWAGHFFLLALLRSGGWRTFARELPMVAAERDHGLARTFMSHILISNTPAAVRRLTHRLLGRDPHSVARYSPLNPAFVAECDLPQQWHENGFDPWFRKSGWHPARHRAFQLFDNNQPARDGEALFGEQYGFDPRAPYADRGLLEFALSVPEQLHRRDGVPRSFARAVFADRLPREILDERRRGAQGGAWFRRLDVRRQDIAAEVENLEASPLARRVLDLPRLKRLVDAWPADEREALTHMDDYKLVLTRGVHIGRFIRWVEGGNA